MGISQAASVKTDAGFPADLAVLPLGVVGGFGKGLKILHTDDKDIALDVVNGLKKYNIHTTLKEINL